MQSRLDADIPRQALGFAGTAAAKVLGRPQDWRSLSFVISEGSYTLLLHNAADALLSLGSQ
jgi:hypothetical protein